MRMRKMVIRCSVRFTSVNERAIWIANGVEEIVSTRNCVPRTSRVL
jgi:hypothetical protein